MAITKKNITLFAIIITMLLTCFAVIGTTTSDAASKSTAWNSKSKDGKCYIGQAVSAKNRKAGDQTGKEVLVTKYRNIGWTHVIRPKNKAKAAESAKVMYLSCVGNKVGYNTSSKKQILSYYYALKKAKADPQKLAACNTSCSSMIAAIHSVIGAGKVSPYVDTKSLLRMMKKDRKHYTAFTSKKYTRSAKYLRPGDVLVRIGSGSHAAMVVQTGSGVK